MRRWLRSRRVILGAVGTASARQHQPGTAAAAIFTGACSRCRRRRRRRRGGVALLGLLCFSCFRRGSGILITVLTTVLVTVLTFTTTTATTTAAGSQLGSGIGSSELVARRTVYKAQLTNGLIIANDYSSRIVCPSVLISGYSVVVSFCVEEGVVRLPFRVVEFRMRYGSSADWVPAYSASDYLRFLLVFGYFFVQGFIQLIYIGAARRTQAVVLIAALKQYKQ